MIINPNIALIEAIPGVGGDESKIWMADLLMSYIKYATRHAFKAVPVDEHIIKITGEGVYGLFKHETGVHRVQRIPHTERKGRIHTSTAVMVVLPRSWSRTCGKSGRSGMQFYRARQGRAEREQMFNRSPPYHKPTGIVTTASQERVPGGEPQNSHGSPVGKALPAGRGKKKGVVQSFVRNIGTGERSDKIRTYNFPRTA
jgi:peptide chain release factor 1